MMNKAIKRCGPFASELLVWRLEHAIIWRWETDHWVIIWRRNYPYFPTSPLYSTTVLFTARFAIPEAASVWPRLHVGLWVGKSFGKSFWLFVCIMQVTRPLSYYATLFQVYPKVPRRKNREQTFITCPPLPGQGTGRDIIWDRNNKEKI